MKLTLGFSPCPNDCFIFDALVHHKIDTEGLQFEVCMEDVEALNNKAFLQELDITKLSYHAFFQVYNNYVLLNSGSALGFGCGPLLVSKKDFNLEKISFENLKVAIPGKHTTANFLLGLAYPKISNKVELLFSEIEEAVLTGVVDAGLLIHENRFTYEQKGLSKICDLGEFWENLIKAPIPLGGIVMRRNYKETLIRKVDRLIRQSVEFAFSNPDSSIDFVRENAQEMDYEVMRKHIDLYVNSFSMDLGELGWQAVNLMHKKGLVSGLISGFENISLGYSHETLT